MRYNVLKELWKKYFEKKMWMTHSVLVDEA